MRRIELLKRRFDVVRRKVELRVLFYVSRYHYLGGVRSTPLPRYKGALKKYKPQKLIKDLK